MTEDITADLTALGSLDQPVSEISGTATAATPLADFVNGTLGYLAALGLPEPQFKISAEEFKETAAYLQMGDNVSKLVTIQVLSPTQGLILGTVLFGITVVIRRPDIRAKLMGRTVKKSLSEKPKSTSETKIEKDNIKVSPPRVPESEPETPVGEVG